MPGKRTAGAPHPGHPTNSVSSSTDAHHSSLDELLAGVRSRDAGTEAAWAAASLSFRDALEHALARVVAAGRPFTADDVRDLVNEPALSGSWNALGALLLAAARRGEIRPADYTRSRRVSNQARVVRLWEPTS